MEDNPATLASVSLFLREHGYSVVQAIDGTQALKRLDSGLKIDLVLSDIALPGIDGYKLLQHVRSMFPGTPAVLMSGNFTLGCPPVLNGGADAHISKPFKLEHLLQQVQSVLKQRLTIVEHAPAGGFGLTLAMIGLDPVEAIPRFTFEGVVPDGFSMFLWDGINLVSVTVGLFAIPEIIDLAIQRTSIARESAGKLGGVMEGVKDTFRHWWLVIRCSGLGAYVGILPGVGGGTAQWVAYAQAVQSSPNKERFGNGAVEGVLGPGTMRGFHPI